MNTFDQIRVLLVGSNSTELHFIRSLLGCNGNLDSDLGNHAFELESAPSLASACERIDRGGIDIVLLDLHFPENDGLPACVRILEHAPFLPLVVLTEPDATEMSTQAMERGAQDFLVKQELQADLLSRTLTYAIERKRTQECQRQSDERLRMITEQLPAVLWTTDRQLRFTSSMGAGLEALNLQPEKVIGMPLKEYFQTDCDEFLPIASHRRALAGESVSFDYRWCGHAFHAHVEPLRNASAQIIGTLGVALDISDQRRMEDELQVARNVQQSLFPERFPDIPGFEVAGAIFPTDETAGDYFDFIPMSHGCVGIVIGDVTGHGLGPALLMAEVRAYLRVLGATYREPGTILTLANRYLAADLADYRFVTLFFGCLDPSEKSLTYAAAGHAGYLMKSSGTRIQLSATGLPLGLSRDSQIQTHAAIRLETGDLLAVLTDGFHEAQDKSRVLFGMNRVLDIIREYKDESCARIIGRVHEHVLQYSAGQRPRDDMSAVILKCGDAV